MVYGSVMHNIGNHPLVYLIFSLIPLGLAIYGTTTGTAVVKSSRFDRVKNPFGYWFTLAFEYGLFAWFFSLAIIGLLRHIPN
jgi:hypothetical protein